MNSILTTGEPVCIFVSKKFLIATNVENKGKEMNEESRQSLKELF
jgi:hypothetical protein